jgi:hypothetical protein
VYEHRLLVVVAIITEQARTKKDQIDGSCRGGRSNCGSIINGMGASIINQPTCECCVSRKLKDPPCRAVDGWTWTGAYAHIWLKKHSCMHVCVTRTPAGQAHVENNRKAFGAKRWAGVPGTGTWRARSSGKWAAGPTVLVVLDPTGSLYPSHDIIRCRRWQRKWPSSPAPVVQVGASDFFLTNYRSIYMHAWNTALSVFKYLSRLTFDINFDYLFYLKIKL